MSYKISVWGCLSNGRILYVEVEKDFLDVLLSLLELPVGRLLHAIREGSIGESSPKGIDSGGMATLMNMYDSLSSMEGAVFRTERCKSLLLEPRTWEEKSKSLSKSLLLSCLLGVPHSDRIGAFGGQSGYVTNGVAFIVTEDLQIFRSVTSRSTKLFLQMGVTDFEDVHVMELMVGKEEVLEILKHSLTPSGGILSALFGDKFQEQVREIRKSGKKLL